MVMLPTVLFAEDAGLVGFWPLRGDCLDHSGHGLDGINHGVKLETSEFDGRSPYIEIPNAAALAFAGGDFSITAEIYTEKGLDDCLGDIVSKFAATDRRGFNLTLVSNTSGYNSQSDQRQLFFGLDNARRVRGPIADVLAGRQTPLTHSPCSMEACTLAPWMHRTRPTGLMCTAIEAVKSGKTAAAWASGKRAASMR